MNREVTTEELLSSCDREPIHVPGAVQPHGLLLAVDQNGDVVAHAGDTGLIEGQDAKAWLQSSLEIPPAKLFAALPSSGQMLLGNVQLARGAIDVVGHRSAALAIVEIEPSDSAGVSASALLSTAQSLASRIDSAHDLVEVCQQVANTVRLLTGYERIMVYRFLGDDSGDVVAEARADDVESLLHHRFPATDIPRQARRLYSRNPIRVIADVDYTPAPVVWNEGADADSPIDMSDAHLRSVSPIHIQYLKNMGVAASASISIMVDNVLWGLVACHHGEPRPLGYVQREMAKHVGQLLGSQISVRQRTAAQLETVRLSQRRDELLHLLTGIGGIEDSLLRHPLEIGRLLPSDGLAVVTDEHLETSGSVPPEAHIRPMLAAMSAGWRDPVISTHRIVDRYEDGKEFAAAASGALICRIRRDPDLSVIWFRAEQVQTVDWAGNPHKPVDDESGILTPRKSFDLWRDTVRCESRRWTAGEIDAAERFRLQIIEILDQQELKRLNKHLRRTLSDKEELIAQKDLLMREVHHRVQNSLQLVNSMLHVQERDAGSDEIRGQFELARQRLTAVAMVHRRLWRADKLGDVRLDTFIAELVEELVKIWGPEWEDSVQMQIAPITLPTDTAILIGLILTELLTNAVKYAYGGEIGIVAIDAVESGRGSVRLTIADRGVGFGPESRKQSFGTRLVETLVRQIRGRVELRDNDPGAKVELHFPIPGQNG